jgi:hypothetical protein
MATALFVDDSPEAVLRRERIHRDQLKDELEKIPARIAYLETRKAAIERELNEAPPDFVPPRRERISDTLIRQVAEQLRTFTLGEWSARTGVPIPTLRLRVGPLVEEGILYDTEERFGHWKIYALVEPEPEPTVEPHSSNVRKPSLIELVARPLQIEVRKAIANGWAFSRSGKDGQAQLTRKGHVTVEFPIRPKNTERVAKKVHNELRASRDHHLRAAREAA